MRSITLNVCQGVGDIFWVYQKFAPHVDEITFCITMVPGGMAKVQTRAVEFLKLLPKVKDVTTKTISSEHYGSLAHGRFPMKGIMDAFNRGEATEFDYACNDQLEHGIRIEDIDPEFSIEETVAIRDQQAPLAFEPGEFVTLYVSGTTENQEIVNSLKLWTVPVWAEFVKCFYEKYGLNSPLVIIGASYDMKVALELESLLRRNGFKVQVYIDSFPANVMYILKNSKAFIGYQSGLNILADNVDTKQVMLYFPYLYPMMYSWCKKKNWDSGVFCADTFDRKPSKVLEGLKMKF